MINSVVKAIRILNLFSAAEPRLSLATISARMEMPKSTVHNLLNTLLAQGFIEKVDGDHYALGAAPLSLTQRIRVNVEVRDPAAPLLRHLADVTHESVYLTVLDGDFALYIYAIESPQRLEARTAVGNRAHLHCTAVGKAMLAHLAEEECSAILARQGLPAFTPLTITDAALLAEELALTRRRGFSIDCEGHERGAYCIGAPIFAAQGTVLGACSVSGVDPEIIAGRLDVIAPQVLQTAQQISRLMGFVPMRRSAHAESALGVGMQLFDLAADPQEQHNLIESLPVQNRKDAAMSRSSFTHLWLEAPLSDAVLARLPAGVQVIRALPLPPIYANAAPAQAMVASSLLRYDAAVMDACPHLRLIARTGIGVDNVDVDAATARGVLVVNTPDGPTESTAEHTVAMLLALAKRLKPGMDNLVAGHWGPRTGVLLGDEVQGKTLGLVGFGRIGRRVAEICRLAFQMRVLACDPYLNEAVAAELGVTLAPLDAVIRQADFLSLHAPATPETIGLMNAERIGAMKPGAYLLNLARGSLVVEAALLAALERGHLAGAGLDVFATEPPALENRLRTHPAVIATPHAASVTREGRRRMEEMAMERLLAFFRGERPADMVNPVAWPEVLE